MNTETETFDGMKFAEAFENAGPAITEECLGQIETDIGSNQPWGPWRRTALAFLTRSGQELVESVEGDRETAEAMAQAVCGIQDYADTLKELAGLMEMASLRLRMALAWREDGNDIMQATEAQFEPSTPHLSG